MNVVNEASFEQHQSHADELDNGQLVMTFEPETVWLPAVSIEARAIGLRGILSVFAKQNSSRGLLKAVRRADHAPELEERMGSSKLHGIVLPIVRESLDPKHSRAKKDFIKAGGYNPNSNDLYEDWTDFNTLYFTPKNAKAREAYQKTLDGIIAGPETPTAA